MAKIIDLDIELPLIVEPVRPNLVEVGTPEIIYVGSTSIEVSQSFESDVDYYGGIYVGENSDNNDDATLVKNPSYLNKTITGLSRGTTYYLNGVALPVMGNISLGNQISVTTGTSPVPDEYQLVEYLESNGTQYINTNAIAARNIGVYLKAMPLTSQSTSFGQSNGNRLGFSLLYQNRIVLYYNTTYYLTAIPVSVGNIYEYVFNYNNDGRLGLINNYVTPQYADPSPFALFAFGLNYNGPIEMAPQRIYQLIITEDTHEIRNMYPVYRKADHKPGLYDIINNVFYTNQGSGEFTVGPDKE